MSVRQDLLMLESNIFDKKLFKEIKFWKTTSKCSGWKMTSNYFKVVLRSPIKVLLMLLSKFYQIPAISLLFRWGWGGLEELTNILTQIG